MDATLNAMPHITISSMISTILLCVAWPLMLYPHADVPYRLMTFNVAKIASARASLTTSLIKSLRV